MFDKINLQWKYRGAVKHNVVPMLLRGVNSNLLVWVCDFVLGHKSAEDEAERPGRKLCNSTVPLLAHRDRRRWQRILCSTH